MREPQRQRKLGSEVARLPLRKREEGLTKAWQVADLIEALPLPASDHLPEKGPERFHTGFLCVLDRQADRKIEPDQQPVVVGQRSSKPCHKRLVVPDGFRRRHDVSIADPLATHHPSLRVNRAPISSDDEVW